MKVKSQQRSEVLKTIADRILSLEFTTTVRVAIEGVDGAGKTVFADELAEVLQHSQRQIIRASVDGFHNSREVRYRLGRGSPEGFYLDSYNYVGLKEALLDPVSPHGSRCYRRSIFDHFTNSALSKYSPFRISSGLIQVFWEGIGPDGAGSKNGKSGFKFPTGFAV